MNWNPFKRIAKLEKDHAKTIEKLTDFSILLRGRIEVLERTQTIHEHNLKELRDRDDDRAKALFEQQTQVRKSVESSVKHDKLNNLYGEEIQKIIGALEHNKTRVVALEKRLQEVKVQTNPVAAMTMGEFKKAKLREYARARYARKKAEKLAAKEQAK